MTLLSTAQTQKRDPQKTRDDWIVAALSALIEEGIEGVRILKLSKSLGVTRGSFYWHFENLDELLSAMVAEWRVRNTGIMLDVLEQSKTLEDGVLDLFAVWVDHSKFMPLLDQAIRDWGRRSDDIQALVSQEDDNRIAAISAFYQRHGYEKIEAFVRARVIYFTQLSYYALVGSEPFEKRKEYLETYFHCFTGRSISAQASEAFFSRILGQKAPS
ncbi:TetR/AcrR family transcriptional regulator [Amylibacter sp. IMCC11727]|uniref:TetR/AcrR family transcriptional regulator n=1 Tax=Amylibacter sp. IMCC11727 TaxID=3039851 RepID=UPI00244DF2EE|nr:TetR/AcrR family transcriptional regulator [Amylibacter sp. IMCC11727]WGI21251.1 TetR/AcrR family transcriptional regulator [Amylibacter sp. IMCC11727]